MRHPDYVDYRSYASYTKPVESEYHAYEASGDVPKGFFERMIAKLDEITGPAAFHIVHDAIRALGERPESFPESRLNELTARIAREILDENLRRNFLRWIATETQAAELN
jgi:hypothetical protein